MGNIEAWAKKTPTTYGTQRNQEGKLGGKRCQYEAGEKAEPATESFKFRYHPRQQEAIEHAGHKCNRN